MGKTTRMKKATKMVLIIRKSQNGEIHYLDLMDELDVSESVYYNLKKYVEHRHSDWVKYVKSVKCWRVVNEAYILPQKTLEELSTDEDLGRKKESLKPTTVKIEDMPRNILENISWYK